MASMSRITWWPRAMMAKQLEKLGKSDTVASVARVQNVTVTEGLIVAMAKEDT